MEKEISNYIRKHTTLIIMIVLVGFSLLAMGEYLLYRNQMKLNKMVSEGLMQIKEQQKKIQLKPVFK